jgi:hypothetical protein
MPAAAVLAAELYVFDCRLKVALSSRGKASENPMYPAASCSRIGKENNNTMQQNEQASLATNNIERWSRIQKWVLSSSWRAPESFFPLGLART